MYLSETGYIYSKTYSSSEGIGFESKIIKMFKGAGNLWNNFIDLVLKIASPNISAAVAVMTKNPQAAQATSNISTNLSRRKISILTDMFGKGLSLKII